MIQYIKSLTQKQKIIVYLAASLIAILAAIIAVILLVFAVENPPNILISNGGSHIYTSSSNTTISSFDTQNTPIDIKNPDAPQIKGIINGATYYTTQFVTVFDNNLTSVTVNGDDQNKTFYIDGNDTNMYVIEASDADENTTVYTVYTKPIFSLFEPISHLNEYTVTADDYDIIKSVENTILKNESKYSSHSEIAELNDIVNTCEKFIKKINDIDKKITEITDTVNKYEKTGEFTNINQVITDIEALLASNNLTQKQRSLLGQMNSKCYSWMSIPSQDEYVY